MQPAIPPVNSSLLTLIRLAAEEDLSTPGDLTSLHAIPANSTSTAHIVARRPGTLSGTFLIPAILAQYSPALTSETLTPDASRLTVNQPVAKIAGPTRALLSAERVLLNFLGHLSGIATATAKYVDAVSHVPKPPVICDTRKTTPGFRVLDKYAVRCGGGQNHRMGLYDGVMLKDNHLAALRDRLGHGLTLAELTARLRKELPSGVMLWLEVDTLEQLADALPGGGADVILLDNFDPPRMREGVAMRDKQGKHPLLEASGGITLDNITAVAETGVDRISIGALTHSAPVLDLSMEFG